MAHYSQSVHASMKRGCTTWVYFMAAWYYSPCHHSDLTPNKPEFVPWGVDPGGRVWILGEGRSRG